ncbi:MAG: cation:proton antiporter [Planctomycetaceae bacterium]|nr:cation:proton antiporter [Planctomycetaceae bacterium]
MERRPQTSLAIAQAGLVLPFSSGILLAFMFCPAVSRLDLPFAGFTLFAGSAITVVAFPALTRSLTQKVCRIRRYIVTLACGADDVSAWCLLVLVVGVARSDVPGTMVLLSLTLVYLGFTPFLTRPLIAAVPRRCQNDVSTRPAITSVFVTVLLGAGLTRWIGNHALFGAFLVGSVLPGDWLLLRRLASILQQSITILLLPAFCAFPGLPPESVLVSAAQAHLICAAVIVVFSTAEFGGTLLVARLCGVPWSRSDALGVLMKTRGLMELIVLNLGFDQRDMSPTLVGTLFITAVAATTAAGPLLRRGRTGRARCFRQPSSLEISPTSSRHHPPSGRTRNTPAVMLHCTLDSTVVDWIRDYPETQAVFEDLRIDVSCDGKSLEFLCHQQGCSPEEVLNRLHERVAAACRTPPLP